MTASPKSFLGSLLLLVAMGLPAIGAAAVAQTNGVGELSTLRSAFEKQIKIIEGETTDRLLTWPEQYAKELDALRKRLQAAGNREGSQAADEEQKRFQRQRQLGEADLVARPELRALQEKYIKLTLRVSKDRNTRIRALAEMYVERLTALQTRLTAAGKTKDALAASAEIERVNTLPQVIDAGGVEGVEEEAPPPPLPGEGSGSSRPAVETNRAAPAPPAVSVAAGAEGVGAAPAASPPLPAGVKIYNGYNMGPAIPDVTLKTITLSATDKAKVSRTLAVAAMLGAKTKSSNVYYYESLKYVLRISIRPANMNVAVENAVMVVQYFGKGRYRNAGKTAPPQLSQKIVPLSKIDATQSVTVDCPLETTHGPYYYGYAFYGVIISVFDGNGALIHQSASNNTLERMGVAQLPK